MLKKKFERKRKVKKVESMYLENASSDRRRPPRLVID